MSPSSFFRRLAWALATGFVFVGLVDIGSVHAQTSAPAAKAKYVFLFIGDGMGAAHRTAAEIFQSPAPEKGKPVPSTKRLRMNSLPVAGLIWTGARSSLITDSGAAGTAMATGRKADIAAISMDEKTNEKYTTIAEMAKASSMRVGILTSTSIYDATPSAFYAHATSRGLHADIAKMLAASSFDYFAGLASDGRDANGLLMPDSPQAAAIRNGFTIVTNGAGLSALRPGVGRVWVCLPSTEGNVPVAYEIDRPRNRPSLADLTRKGIELLDNPKGFFAMIEGAMIDHASHESDGAAMVREVLALDEAVGEAMAFAAKHRGETLIVVAADHETGALAVGGTGGGSLNFMAAKLSGQKGSHEVLEARIKDLRAANASFEQILAAVKDFLGLEELADSSVELLRVAYEEGKKPVRSRKDEQSILYGKLEPLTVTATRLLSRQGGLGWGSLNHSAMPLPVTAGGIGSERFTGCYENTEIFTKLLSVMPVGTTVPVAK